MGKRLWEWIKHPHGWSLALFYLLTIGCIAGSVVFTVLGLEKYGVAAYIFYVLAAITLSYTVYTLVIYVPVIKRKITEKLKANQFTAALLEDYDFKTAVFSVISFGITVAFALMNLAGAIQYKLVWYAAIAAYYFGLVFFRGGVLLADNRCAKRFADNEMKYEKSKWRIYLASGAFMVIVELAMMVAITQMMLSKRPTESGMVMAIANAVYAFYKITMAIYNLVKAHKLSNPVTQSLRNLNFADACMSIVSLTVLLISTFVTEDSDVAMGYVKAIVGFVVCVVLIAVASAMIIRATKKLKSFQEESENERSGEI